MRLGMFGGTFDPPHLGHLVAAEFAYEHLQLDSLLFIPTGKNPLKLDREESLPKHRLEMTSLAIEHNSAFELSSIEIERGGPSYTIDTITSLKELFKPTSLHLIVGHDNTDTFPRWLRIEDILSECSVVVCKRAGTHQEIPDTILSRIEILDSPIVEISSTDIRERVRAGRSIRYLVPETVRKYIEMNHLYRG